MDNPDRIIAGDNPQPLSATVYVVISLVGLTLTIGLLLLYIFKAPQLIQNGINNQVFYVLLIPLGFIGSCVYFRRNAKLRNHQWEILWKCL